MTETFYSNGIYKIISWTISHITGWLPFSVAEFLLIILVLFMIGSLVTLIGKMIRDKIHRWIFLGNAVLNLLVITGILYFSFVVMWGLNYNRLSLSKIINLTIKPASVNELRTASEDLLQQANQLRLNVPEDSNGIMVPIGGIRGGLQRAEKGYLSAVKQYPQFAGTYSQPKPIALSSLMAYTNIWGIFIPFTVEANVNIAIPSPLLLPTITHEMAHERGFAREDEANYIAYVTCRMHPDVDFRYSGILFALTHTMNFLYQYDRTTYLALIKQYGDGVKRDLAEISKFDKKYDTPTGKFFTKTNDIYLKANNQKDGERSYGRMVDLLLAEYRMLSR